MISFRRRRRFSWRIFSVDSLASALPGTSNYMGYPLLRRVPLSVWGTSICMGYLYLYGVPLFVWDTSNCAGYLYLYGVPQVMSGTSDYVGYLRLCWYHSIGWHVALYYLSHLSLKQHPPSFFLARSIGGKRNSLYEWHVAMRLDRRVPCLASSLN